MLLAFLRQNWPYLAAGMLLTFGSSYGQTFFISLFAAQIKSAFSLTDGGWGLAYTFATTASAIAMVWAGALTDRFRIRALARLTMLGLATACLMMTLSPAYLWLIATVFLLRFFGQGMMSQLASVAMARWFSANRGKALSISSMGFSLGTAFLPILVAALLTLIDWRAIWVLAAAVTLLAIPLLTRLLRQERTPQSMAEESQSLGMGARHWSRREALTAPVFWLLVPTILGPAAWGTSIMFHQVHLTGVKGWAFLSYVALYPLATAATITTTITMGFAIDRIGATRLVPIMMLPFAASFALMYRAETITGAAVALLVFGIGQGTMATTLPAASAELFGTRYLGAIKAAISAIMVFGSAVGPGISGALIDAGTTFEAQLLWWASYFLIAAAMAALAARLALPRLSAPA